MWYRKRCLVMLTPREGFCIYCFEYCSIFFFQHVAFSLKNNSRLCFLLLPVVFVASTWIKHGSRNLTADTLKVERHWASHVCFDLTLHAAQQSFLDRANELAVSPARSGHTLKRCSLYANNWNMATPVTMRSDRKDMYVPGCPFFRLAIPQRAMALHSYKCWW